MSARAWIARKDGQWSAEAKAAKVEARRRNQTEPSRRGTGVLRPGGDGRNAPTVRPPLGAPNGPSGRSDG